MVIRYKTTTVINHCLKSGSAITLYLGDPKTKLESFYGRRPETFWKIQKNTAIKIK